METVKLTASDGGGVTYWSISSIIARGKLHEGLAPLGLGKFTPEEKTDNSALLAALKQEFCPTAEYMAQPRKDRTKNGFEVVHVRRDEFKNHYLPIVHGWHNKGVVYLTELPNGQPIDKSGLQRAFDDAKGVLSGQSVGPCLVEIVGHLGGVSLRPAGGIYWLPEHSLATWEAVGKAIEAAAVDPSKANEYLLRTVIDGNSIRAIKAAIVDEVTAEAEQIKLDLRSGDLGERATANRKRKALALEAKVTLYESILQETLKPLHDAVAQSEENSLIAMFS